MTNIEVIQEFYRSFREKDDEAFRQICSDDLEWIDEGFPHRAMHKGADAVFERVCQGQSGQWEGVTYHIEKILESGSAVVVFGHYEDSHQVAQKAAKAAHVYDIRDRKVCRFRMFADSHPMWEAMSTFSGNGVSQSFC
ncbi:MAG: nuclear transport factor 2 family protein [Leptolyngbya sp. SIO1E4]|nr:nuclear transport factor 2 family protein [Leptolyngbya sp. SIO1E4]